MAIVTIQTPSGSTVQIEAPEGATDDQIFRFAKSQGLFDQQEQPKEVSNTPLDVPTDENLAFNAAQLTPKQDISIPEAIIGAGETALTTLTGATGGAAGFLSAVPGAVAGELTGRLEQGEGLKEASERAADFTYQPRTAAGQELTSDLSEVLGVLPPVLGVTPLNTIKPLIAGKAITNKLLKNPRMKRQLLADEIKRGNPNVELIGKALNESGDIITRPASKRAVKVLGGDSNAQGVVSVIESMNPASKAQFNKMLDIVEKGGKNPLFKDANRASDVLGMSIANRARAISKLNKKAGSDIGNVASSMRDVNVDIKQPSNQFFNSLSDLGVTFTRGKDGWVTPDFSRSKFVGGSQKDMSVLVNDLMNGTPDFETAHKLKRSIRDNVNFDKGGTGQLSQSSEKILKDLSRNIDSVLDDTSPAYRKANESFAKTIKLKEDLDKLAGKDIDLDGALSPESLGGKAMRLVSNAESRVPIKQALHNTDKVLGEFGIRFKDDVPSLIHLSAALDDIFKLSPSKSLKGNIVSAGVEVADALTSPIGAARAVGGKVKEISVPDFKKKIRHLRAISSNKKTGNK